ncbi:MAG: thiolase family protein [Firmicutes bacterium]|nr:thiolase family protein [Bacillota bacterium]
MAGKVAVVSWAQTEYREAHDETIRELVFRVAREALDRAGLTREELGTVITASSDYWQGISCSNEYYLDAAGGYLKSGAKAEEDGALAFMYAFMRVASGHFDTALVVAVTKGSEIPPPAALTHLYSEPFFQRPVGIDGVNAAAMQARLYVRERGAAPEHFARVVVKNLSNAARNPVACRRRAPTVEEVLQAPVVADPLRGWDLAPGADGACALLLAGEDTARRLTDRPVWVRGVGWSVSSYYLGDRDLLDGSLPDAARRAYRMAGIANPRAEIRVAEVCEEYSFQELLWCEQLGLCGPGEGPRLLEEGVTAPGGELPVNPSGGVLAGNPYCARGLVRIIEAAAQVAGRAGEHQVEGAHTALAHSCHGLAGQLHSVVILGR